MQHSQPFSSNMIQIQMYVLNIWVTLHFLSLTQGGPDRQPHSAAPTWEKLASTSTLSDPLT